jgi:hypothetical protein
MGQSLVSLDTDRIKEYIFATAKLREISGASAILRDLNEQTMPSLAETYQAQTIYVGGGSGLFVVPSDRAHDLITAVQRAYRERTAGAATITGVALPLPDNFSIDHSPAQEIWRCIGYKLAAAKLCPASPRPLVTHPLFKTCDSDAAYYACAFDPQDQSYLSAPTRAKRDCYQAERQQGNKKLPEDFDDIADVSRPTGYFALIYIDGDNFGRVLE